jgi:membrane fusion protein
MKKLDEENEGQSPQTGLRVAATPLFRTQALEAQRGQALGAVLLVQPISTRLLTLAAVAIAASLIAFAFWGEYTRKARVKGFLVPTRGLIKVYPREAGTVVEKQVVEGQRVSKGDVLFVVAMERPSGEAVEARAAAIARLRERRASLEGELRQMDHIAGIEAQTLEQRIGAMEAELAQLVQEITTQASRVASAESTHARYRKLRAEAIASEEQVQEKLKDLLEEQGKLQALERTQLSLTREINTLRAQLAASELKAGTLRAATERNVSTLEQELAEYEARRTFVVRAPADGTATALLADRGQAAKPSQPLVSILPADATLEAHLLVPSHSIGFLAPNQTVSVRHEAFPSQRFGSYRGRVAEISKTLILPGETALPFQLLEPAYRVTVALDSQSVKAYGQDFPLQAGMLLDADIWLDRRQLYEWLLDPLYSVLGRV